MMETAVIICNGEFPEKEYPTYLIRTATYIICCDGAADTFMRRSGRIFGHERRPDVVIGDLDSIPQDVREKLKDITVKVEEQENNDLDKAFRHVMENFPDVGKIHILGAGGKREDHTVGNLSYLMEYAMKYPEKDIDMVSDWTTAFAISRSCSFFVGAGREVSIFTADNTLRIKSEGLHWKTDDVVFDNWWKATLNKADSDEVRLTLSHRAAVLIILD